MPASSATARFRLAPMDIVISALTYGLWGLLLVLGGVWWMSHNAVALSAPGIMLGVYAFILIALRPTGFVLDGDGLRIDWPIRSLRVPRHTLVGAERIDRGTFRAEFGWPIRVGAGGLYGSFGYLWTSQKGWIDVEASRTSDFVLVRSTERTLLLTPDRPDVFVRRLNALVSSP